MYGWLFFFYPSSVHFHRQVPLPGSDVSSLADLAIHFLAFDEDIRGGHFWAGIGAEYNSELHKYFSYLFVPVPPPV